jgi:hypothetical protein
MSFNLFTDTMSDTFAAVYTGQCVAGASLVSTKLYFLTQNKWSNSLLLQINAFVINLIICGGVLS